MDSSEPLAQPPLIDHAALAETILTAGLGLVLFLMILGAAFEMLRKR